jgi:lipopolysaccharide export system permease protein
MGKLLYRYISSKFWPPFLFALGIFAALVFLGDVFSHMNDFANTAAPARIVLKYFMYSIPFWTLIIVPVASLLASLFVLAEMVGNGEWVAGMSSGYKPRQLTAPVIVCCALVALCHFTLTETVSPNLRRKSEFILERYISGNKYYHQGIQNNLVVRVADGIFLSARQLNAATGELASAALSFESGGRVVYQVEAASGRWESGRQWVFYNGIKRILDRDGRVTSERFERWPSGLSMEPQFMSMDKIWPEDVTLYELSDRIGMLRKIGAPSLREEVFLHSKMAAPFVDLLLCLVAIPFAVSVRRGGKMLHFTAAIALAFFFWWTTTVAQSAGEAGMLSPSVSAWLPVAVFSCMAAFLFAKAGI